MRFTSVKAGPRVGTCTWALTNHFWMLFDYSESAPALTRTSDFSFSKAPAKKENPGMPGSINQEMASIEANIAALEDRSLLLLDDDKALRSRLARALEARGFQVTTASNVFEATNLLRDAVPAFAVLDMRLDDGNGLKLAGLIHERRKGARIVMLTGYSALATAVAAIKAGATDYLAKPADADDIVRALFSKSNAPEIPSNPMTADRVRWEHIQRVYELCNANVSETARRLSMHRRTLQRILAKRAPQ